MISREITTLIDKTLANGFKREDLLLHIIKKKHISLYIELNMKMPFKVPAKCIKEFRGVKVVVITNNYFRRVPDFWLSLK